MVAVASIFFASLAGIIALFWIKAWEANNGRTLVPRLRMALDSGAHLCKERLVEAEEWFVRLPSLTANMSLRILALTAIQFAKLARSASEGAHQLADFVSHKRNFERREVRSDFLKQVIEHKNGLNGNGNGKKRKSRLTRSDIEI